MAIDILIPISFLRECFDSYPETGIVCWKERPREHFTSTRGWRIFNKMHAGRQITYSPNGYPRARVRYQGRIYGIFLHRIVSALAKGRWPPQEIDHWDHNPANSRLSNLREATPTQNQHNRKNPRGYFRHRNKFAARIVLARKTIHLGTFDTEEEAHQAYLRAKKKYHPSSSSHGE
jgi:HNH endonuclease/AP2 domain